MKRLIVLVTLLTVGALSLAVTASQQPRWRRRAQGRRGREAPRQSVHAEGRGRQHGGLRRRVGRGGRGYEESRVGPADPGQNQGTDAEAHHDHHQYAHARRPRERERRVSGDRRGHRAREHRSEHAGDARVDADRAERSAPEHLQGQQRPRHAEEDLQGPDDDRDRRRPHRPVLLRARPHQRRRLCRVSRAARHARRRHLLDQGHPGPRCRQRRERSGDRRHADEGRRHDQEHRHHHHGAQHAR